MASCPGSKHCRRRRNRGFTLAEALAAMAFLALVLPVTLEGLRVASRIGQVGQRKAVATRLADRVLNEAAVLSDTSQSRGVIEEGNYVYEWNLTSESWSEASMRLVTAQVTFLVQDREFDVRVSTLLPSGAL